MAASSINAISGLLDHMYICTGNTVAGSKSDRGVSAINATMPIISKGEDSPKILAIARTAPCIILGNAIGKEWSNITLM